MSQTTKEVDGVPKRTVSDILADIRNGAIILAALVFSFHWATQGSSGATEDVSKKTIEIAPVAIPSKAPAIEPQGEPSMVASHKITEALGKRIAELKDSKPVVLKSVAAIRESQARLSANSQEEQAPQDVTPGSATITTPDGQATIPKLGYAPDGSRLSAAQKSEQIKTMLSNIPENFTINWKAENEKVNLYVFTDPTCPYCKKLHHAIPELNAAGVTVRYFLFPRDLPNSTAERLSPAGQQVSNIWCSIDQKAAFDEAFDGFRVKDASCGDLPADMQRIAPPLSEHYFLGSLVGINGTPTFLTDHGIKGEGFSSVQRLMEQILP